MSDKTFLQELQSIKREAEILNAVYSKNHEKYDMDTLDRMSQIIGSLDQMIDQCLEIQLAMMKQGTMPDVKGR